jgi:hypothetical protein
VRPVRLTFLALPLFLVPLVYGSVYNTSSQYEAYAVPPNPNFAGGACGYSAGYGWEAQSCCWTEGGIVSPKVVKCQTCVMFTFPIFTFDCEPEYTPFTLPPPGVTGPFGGTVDPTPFILPPRGVTGPLGGAVGPVGPNILPFNLRDILTLPENQSYSISVQHGPNSDTIMIEIPKVLSSSILNQTNVSQMLSSSILNQTNVNQTATGLGPQR